MYIDAIAIFKDIAETINPNGTFYHGRIPDANLAIDRKPLPQIHVYPFRVQPSGALDSASNIRIAFLFQDSPNSNDEQRNDITNLADTMQRKFKQALGALDVQVSNWEAEPFYKQFSGVTSGMYVRFKLEYKSSKNCTYD